MFSVGQPPEELGRLLLELGRDRGTGCEPWRDPRRRCRSAAVRAEAETRFGTAGAPAPSPAASSAGGRVVRRRSPGSARRALQRLRRPHQAQAVASCGGVPVRHGGRSSAFGRPHQAHSVASCCGGDPVRHGGRSSAFAGRIKSGTRTRRGAEPRVRSDDRRCFRRASRSTTPIAVALDGAVDADGHILEPPDLWETYIDPAFRDRALRIVLDENGLEELRDRRPAIADEPARLPVHARRDGRPRPAGDDAGPGPHVPRRVAVRRDGPAASGSPCSTPSTSTPSSSTRRSACCGRPRSRTRRSPRPTPGPTTGGSASSAPASRASCRPPTSR